MSGTITYKKTMLKKAEQVQPRLTLRFIKQHRNEIDSCINKHCPGVFGKLNDNVRWNWFRTIVPEKYCHENIPCNKICLNRKRL